MAEWRRRAGLPALASVAAGASGAGLLLGLYFGLVSWANSPAHARQLLGDDWYFVVPIAAGFGLQVGLFTFLRLQRTRRVAGSTAAGAAGTGASSAAMLACCAHHLADVLPLLGVSGAAVFLDDQRTPIMAGGLTVNLLAVTYMALLVRRQLLMGPAPASRQVEARPVPARHPDPPRLTRVRAAFPSKEVPSR